MKLLLVDGTVSCLQTLALFKGRHCLSLLHSGVNQTVINPFSAGSRKWNTDLVTVTFPHYTTVHLSPKSNISALVLSPRVKYYSILPISLALHGVWGLRGAWWILSVLPNWSLDLEISHWKAVYRIVSSSPYLNMSVMTSNRKDILKPSLPSFSVNTSPELLNM